MVKERAKRIRTGGAVVANAFFRPTPIVNSMVRLDRRDYMQLGETVEVLRRHMLRVLNARTPVGLAVRFGDFAVEVENDGNSLITNGVSAKLQARCIGLHHAIAHERERLHFVREQSVIVGLVVKGLKEIGGSRP